MDLRESQAMTYEVGVSLQQQGGLAHDLVDGEMPAPPPGSRLRPARRGEGEESPALLAGRAAVAALGGGIAEQIATVASQIHERLSREDVEPDPSPPTVDLSSTGRTPTRRNRAYVVDCVEVQFGLNATAKSGVGLAIFADVGGSSSIQVTLTIKRTYEGQRPAESDQ